MNLSDRIRNEQYLFSWRSHELIRGKLCKKKKSRLCHPGVVVGTRWSLSGGLSMSL